MRSTWYWTASAGALVWAPHAATAQTAAPVTAQGDVAPAETAGIVDGAEQSGGDIVVTARRKEERLQDVPIAISALTGDTLARSGIQTLEALNSAVPNLNVKTGNASQGSATFTIRGQSQSNILLSVDSAVGIYQDNFNNPRSYGLLSAGLLDLQRIEVLRGPQGTLYGRNTTGGAVSIITQDPKKDFGLSVQGTIGNYDRLEAVAVLNLPVSDDAGFRFVGQRGVRDGLTNSIGPRRGLDDPRQDDSTYIRGKFVGTFGAFQLGITADYFRNQGGGGNSLISGLFDPTLFDTNPSNDGTNLGGNAVREVALSLGLDPNLAADRATARATLLSFVNRDRFHNIYNDQPLSDKNRGSSIVGNLEVDVSESLTVRSITGFREFFRSSDFDFDGTPFDFLSGNLSTDDEFFSEELQVLGQAGPVDYVLGLYYSDGDGREFGDQVNTRLLTGNVRVRNVGDVESRSYAVFGQANWSITDRLRLTAGLRYTREQKNLVNRNSRSTGCVVAPALLDTPGVCAATFKSTFKDPSWLASVDYEVTDDVMVYAKTSRGFRGGGQNLRASGTNLAIYAPFEPETVTEYEIGAKSEFLDRRLLLNVAAFYDDYTDAQRSVTILINGVSSTLVTNAAKARLTGFEAETRLRVTPTFSLNGSLGYLNTKYLEFADLSGDRSDEPFPAPKWNYTLAAELTQPTSFGEIQGNVNWAWQSRQNFQPQARLDDQVSAKSYGVLNARVGVQISSIDTEVALFANNVTNARYNVGAITLESLGFNTLQAGDPRTFGLRVTKRFGSEAR